MRGTLGLWFCVARVVAGLPNPRRIFKLSTPQMVKTNVNGHQPPIDSDCELDFGHVVWTAFMDEFKIGLLFVFFARLFAKSIFVVVYIASKSSAQNSQNWATGDR